MANTRELKILINAQDNASKTISSVGSSVKNLARDATAGAAIITGAFALTTKTMIDTAGSYEQSRIAFETMLGSGDEAGKLLKQISKFARETPFDLPQVVEGSKRLLAYNIEAKDIIPTFKMLGNIASAVGTDKLPQLILAFGQVKAATKLTGAELRQFSEAGVPVLQALVDKANESGGALVNVGGASASTKKKIASLSSTIVDQQFKLGWLAEQGEKGSASYKKLSKSIDFNKAKLESFGSVGEDVFVRVEATAADMIEKIHDGEISFDQLNDALKTIGGEGGKWGDLMARQSATFLGTISNIKDNFIRMSLFIMGFTEEGEIKKGSIFFYLKEGARIFQEQLDTLQPKLASFGQFIQEHKEILYAFVAGLSALFAVLIVQFLALIAPALLVAGAFGLIGAGVGLLIEKNGGLQQTIDDLKAKWEELQPSLDTVKASFESLREYVGGLSDEIDALKNYMIFLKDLMVTLLQPAFDLLSNSIQASIGYFKDLGITNEHVTKVAKILAGLLAGALFVSIMIIVVIVGTLIAGIAGLIAAISKIISVIGLFIQWLKGLYTSFADLIRKVWDSIGILNDFYAIIDKIKRIGKITIDIVQNFVSRGKKETRQHGGFINAPFGQAVPATLHGGERVLPRTGVDVNTGGMGSSNNININFSGPITMDNDSRISDLANRIVEILNRQNELAGKGLAV